MNGTAQTSLRVLHVDDDPVDHLLVARCLRRGPGQVHVRHVSNLMQLSLAVREERPDLILLDLNLGRYERLEALEQLRARGVDVPVVVLTGMDDATIGARAIAMGAEDFLSKDELDPKRLWTSLVHAAARSATRSAKAEVRRNVPLDTQPTARRLPHHLRAGTRVDRYEVEAFVGEGGMACVYRARHVVLGSCHALKIVRPEVRVERERLLQEGRVQAQLSHPNVVGASDVIEVQGAVGLVMEYVSGPTLHDWLRDPRDCRGTTWMGLFRGIVRGVRCAHLAGIVHRDLKPGNVLLQASADGHVPKVTDFGIAKVLGHRAHPGLQTQSGVAMGTPGFMAPEQLYDAASVDHRADLFSLGCLLHLMIGGQRPFTAPGRASPLRALLSGEVTPLQELVPGVPDRVVDLVDALLQPDPEHRLQSCQAVLEALDEVDDFVLCDRIPGRAEPPAASTSAELVSVVERPQLRLVTDEPVS